MFLKERNVWLKANARSIRDRDIPIFFQNHLWEKHLTSQRIHSRGIIFKHQSVAPSSGNMNLEFLGPMRLSEVEEVQLRIVQKLRQLEDQGQVTITRGGVEEKFV